MKQFRIIAILLLLSMLAGCSLPGNAESEVTFYYSRKEFAYGEENPVIVSEKRDIAGHEGDLRYILSLYLMGPLNEDLASIFPGTARLVGVKQTDHQLSVHLTPIARNLSDIEFSLACSSMTMTCMELTDCTSVTVVCGDRSVTLSESDLLLFDNPIPTETQGEENG